MMKKKKNENNRAKDGGEARADIEDYIYIDESGERRRC